VTLHSGETRDAHGNTLLYLANTREDLGEGQQGERTPLLSVEVLDGAITEAATLAPPGKKFEYLLACFKRISRATRATRVSGPEDPKNSILKEAKRLCMSYCIFAITLPEMFNDTAPASGMNPLAQHLLGDAESDVGICTDFLTEATLRFDEDESIKELIVEAAEHLSMQLSQMDMLVNYQPYVRGLRNLLRFPKIVSAITESPLWSGAADIEAQDIETKTLLGPFFRISPMQQAVANNYFSAPKTRDRGYIANAQNAVRMTLKTHQHELFQLADTIVRSGAAPREKLLNWFALCVNKNHKKRAMRVDTRTVSSDGFMVNVTTTLDTLCEPFMDAAFGKIEKIDVDYLRRNPRVDISDETKINMDQKASDAFYARPAEGTNNFISEIFFLTVAAHHYGTEAAQTRMTTSRKTVQRLEKDVEQYEKERYKYLSNPRHLQLFETRLTQAKTQIDEMWSTIHATHGVLLDELNQARSMQLMRYVIVWLLRIASSQNLPREKLSLPLPATENPVFQALPEYFLEDIVDNFKFITSNLPQIITPQQCEEIVQVCVTFLRNSEYVKNPGVKSGLVTILFYGVTPYANHARGVLGDVLIGSTFAHTHLLHALMKFYIEAESTGTHTQFYDKFNIRFEIFQVVKAIWVNTLYRENLAKEARVNTDFFVQFVNMLVNDVTFVLDESLTSFSKIKQLTDEINNPSVMADLNEEQRKEKTEQLEEHKGKAKSYMQLTKETMETLILFTETLAEAFTMKEIVTRLADMLDYNLDTLVGPKRAQLKVQGSAEYGFSPQQLVSDLVRVYHNLSSKESFVEAIARDARSYRPENFVAAEQICRKFALKSPDELQVWTRLAERVAATKAAHEEEEEDLGEIPEEFVDPLMAELMVDPVILPMSRAVVDRSTIRSHLLSVATDPFNRTPLKIEDVIPDVEMKAKIDAWRAEKRAERAKARGDAMDTSQG